MTEQRTCGGCTACCKTHAIRAINKPAGEWCQHCFIGEGCSIYPHRPSGCQNYSCLWVRGLGQPENRPDLAGVVLEYIVEPRIGGPEEILHIVEADQGALESEYVKRLLREQQLIGKIVALENVERIITFIHPPKTRA